MLGCRLTKKALITFILIISTTLIFITIFGEMDFTMRGFEIKLEMKPYKQGFTEIVVPPIGAIKAETHKTPLKIIITLINIDIDFLKTLIEEQFSHELIAKKFEIELKRIVSIFVARMLLISALGGAFAGLLLHKKLFIDYLKNAIVGLAMAGLLIAGTVYIYDINQFSNPQYKGIIKAAPWMISFTEEALVKVDKLGELLRVSADNLYELFEKIDVIRPTGEFATTTKILHVSDIHNNPAAYDFIKQVVDSFEVDMIIDTGDISDFGSALEAKLLNRIESIGKPYLFVTGNHDSPAIIDAMQSISNVIILSDEVRQVGSFLILGMQDPASASFEVIMPTNEEILDSIEKGKILISENENTPDILVVHHPQIAEHFIDKIPVILHGHRHQLSISQQGQAVVVDSGTSGAAGVRGLQSNKEIPYSVVLLHFSTNEKVELKAIDTIKVFNLEGGFVIQRSLYN